MALRPCSECGKEISEKAPVCPHCGAPQAAPAPATVPEKQPTKAKPAPTLAIVLAIALLLVVGFVAWRQLQPALQDVGVVPAPSWVVENAGGDDGCTVLGDYCMRARCLVRNVGDAAGAVTVTAALFSATGGSPVYKSTTVRLEPGQEQTLRFEFFEAEWDKGYQYSCSAR